MEQEVFQERGCKKKGINEKGATEAPFFVGLFPEKEKISLCAAGFSFFGLLGKRGHLFL